MIPLRLAALVVAIVTVAISANAGWLLGKTGNPVHPRGVYVTNDAGTLYVTNDAHTLYVTSNNQ